MSVVLLAVSVIAAVPAKAKMAPDDPARAELARFGQSAIAELTRQALGGGPRS